MKQTFSRDLNALNEVFGFIDNFIASYNLNQALGFSINLVVEELFTNMVKYNQEGHDDISIGFEIEQDFLVITMLDTDSEPFNLTEYNAVDVEAPLEERTPGGLGIHLVKRMMDEVYYQYKDRQTKIKLIKKISPPHA